VPTARPAAPRILIRLASSRIPDHWFASAHPVEEIKIGGLLFSCYFVVRPGELKMPAASARFTLTLRRLVRASSACNGRMPGRIRALSEPTQIRARTSHACRCDQGMHAKKDAKRALQFFDAAPIS